MEQILRTIALYAGFIIAILGAITLSLKSSSKFSRWISTKIVKNADMSDGCIGECRFEDSIAAVLNKLNDLDHIKLTIKRLEYLNVRQHNEDDEILINSIYDEYKRLGGNSYIDMDYERWAKGKTGNVGEYKKKKKLYEKAA